MIEYKVSFTDDEVKCLEAIVTDFQKWLDEAADGKLNQCKKKLIREWQPKLFNDGGITSLPSTENGLINFILTHRTYRSRKDKDYDEREERLLKIKQQAEAYAIKKAAAIKAAEEQEVIDAAQRQAEIDTAVAKALAAQ